MNLVSHLRRDLGKLVDEALPLSLAMIAPNFQIWPFPMRTVVCRPRHQMCHVARGGAVWAFARSLINHVGCGDLFEPGRWTS